MQESSIFGNRTPGDCRKVPSGPVIVYDGTSAVVPTIVNGTIIFGGGIASEQAQGVGYTGAAGTTMPYQLSYHSILDGGAGTRYRTSLDPLKRKVRLTCKNLKCGENGEHLALQVAKIQTCESPSTEWDSWPAPYDVYFECNCLETCCQRLNRMASLINENPDSPVLATVINISTSYYLDLESKLAGVDFRVFGLQGFSAPKDIVPYGWQSFTAYEVSAWIDTAIPLFVANPTKKLTIVEIYTYKQVPTTNAVGTATSNPDTYTYVYHQIKETVRVVFDTATTQSNTALTALTTILTGTNAYNRKLGSSTTVDANYYRYSIVRTDAGDAAALTQARTDYTTGLIQLDRSAYQTGKSYYTFISSSATPPTASGSDVVTQGQFVTNDLPAIADGCPVPENSICLSC